MSEQAPQPPDLTNAPPPKKGGRGRASKDEARRRADSTRAARREETQRALKALSPEKKRELVRVNGFMLGFGALALLAMITLTLGLPWPAVGLVAMVIAVVTAIRGIRLARRTPLARGAVTYLALGLVLLAMFAFYCIPLATTWQEQWEYQRCMSQTQTIEGEDACRAAFEKATESDWRRIFQGGGK
ncbi:MAG: hypothetical protein LBD97_00905 [Bifidobacteriaceae bacterium]|nr:hypothetical protein [Bifidobacteriaceae bacterium]